MTVNKERVQLLVDALRSGEYAQGKNMLRSRRWGFNGSDEALGQKVSEWYGFKTDEHFVHDPQIGHDADGNILTAIRANDDYDWSFTQIADAIEGKYLEEETAQP